MRETGVYGVVTGAISGEIAAVLYGFYGLRRILDWSGSILGILITGAISAIIAIGVFLTIRPFDDWINWLAAIVTYTLVSTLYFTRSDRLRIHFLHFLDAVPLLSKMRRGTKEK